LAEGLARLAGVSVAVDMVRTNMVFFDLTDDVPLASDEVADRLRQTANVWVGTNGPRGFRAVTHCWIGDVEVRTFLGALENVLAQA
jgi:threonine aldolase